MMNTQRWSFLAGRLCLIAVSCMIAIPMVATYAQTQPNSIAAGVTEEEKAESISGSADSNKQ